MPIENITNNAIDSALTADITSGATTMTLTTIVGWPTTGQWRALLRDGTKAEIVLCTPNSGSTYNIQRAVESTVGEDNTVYNTAQAWTAASTVVHHLFTAGSIDTKLAKTGGDISGPVRIEGGSLRLASGPWMSGIEQRARLVAWNNGSQPSSVQRNRPFSVLDLSYFDATQVNSECKGFQCTAFDLRRMFFLPYGGPTVGGGTPRGTLLAYEVDKDFFDVNSYEAVDLRTLLSEPKAEGFLGGFIDEDGWLYLVPNHCDIGAGTIQNNIALRFNTKANSISDASAWEKFDISTMSTPPGVFSWASGCTDSLGNIYYCPVGNPATNVPHGYFLRFNSRGPTGGFASAFLNPANWTTFNLTAVNADCVGYQSIIWTGSHVVLVPFTNSAGNPSGLLLRYDPYNPAGFSSTSSYLTVNLETMLTPTASIASSSNPSRAVAFTGAIMAGPYMVLVPWGGGSGPQRSLTIMLDTRRPDWTQASAWETFDLRTIGLPAFTITNVSNTSPPVVTVSLPTGIPSHPFKVNDQLDIYGVVPGTNPINGTNRVVTAISATTITISGSAPGTYTSGGWISSGAEACVGDELGFFDGHYVHFTPAFNANRGNASTGPILLKNPMFVRWDVTLPFEDPGSWSFIYTPFDVNPLNGGTVPPVCTGVGFDGRFGFHSPFGSMANNRGEIIRIDTGAPWATGQSDPMPDLWYGVTRTGDRVILEDEFRTGGTTTGAIGETGNWWFPGGSVARKAPEANHNGIYTITSAATIGGAGGICASVGASPGLLFFNGFSTQPFDLIWWVRPLALTGSPATAPAYRIGLTDNIANAQPANGIYMEHLAADTTWWINSRVGSVDNRKNTGATFAVATWYKFRIRWDGLFLRYSINDMAMFTWGTPNLFGAATSPPTAYWNVQMPPALPSTSLSPFAMLTPGTVATQTMDVDYCRLIQSNAVR